MQFRSSDPHVTTRYLYSRGRVTMAEAAFKGSSVAGRRVAAHFREQSITDDPVQQHVTCEVCMTR